MHTYPYSSSCNSLMGYPASIFGADEDTAMTDQNPHSSNCCGVDEDTVMTEYRHGLKRSVEEEDSSSLTESFHGNKAQRRTKELLSASPSSNPWVRRSTLLEDAHARLLVEFYGRETILSTLLSFTDDDDDDEDEDEDEDDDVDDGHDDMRAEC